MGVTYLPANPYNSSNALGTLIGKYIGGAIDRGQAENDRLATLKATEIINKMGNNYLNPSPNDQQKADAMKDNGYEIGQNPYEKIADYSGAWQESANKINQLQTSLDNGADPTLTNSQIFAEKDKQKQVSLAATKFRDVLARNKLSLDGFGSGDDSFANWNMLKAAPITVDKAIIPQSTPNIESGIKPGALGIDTVGLENVVDNSQSNLLKNKESITGMKLTQDQFMNVQQVADEARKKAAMDYLHNYSPNAFTSSVTENLLKEKIDPKIIAAVQNKINDQAKNIGMQYAMGQDGVNDGNYTNAAKYAIQHGMPVDTLPLFQGLANKYTTNNIDIGGSIVPTAIVSNSMGATPKSGTIGNEYVKTLTPEGKIGANQNQQRINIGVDQFNKEYELKKQQLGDSKALQWAQLQLQSNKLSLDQKEHIAGKVRVGIDVIKTENDSLTKQLDSIYKNALGALTPGQQYEVDLLKSKINENNSNLAKYGMAVDDSLGIRTPSQKQATSLNYDDTMRQVTNALRNNNAKRNAGQAFWTKEQFKNYMQQNYGDMAQKIFEDTDFKSFGL